MMSKNKKSEQNFSTFNLEAPGRSQLLFVLESIHAFKASKHDRKVNIVEKKETILKTLEKHCR